uniref:C2H2-type domain-containing protein n=1 Tax=Podarcis muralis TaxID=64176 RepID=A0A670JL63_PODMU
MSHKETHQVGIYQCSLCPKEYPSLLALKNHFHGHTKATASGWGSPGGDGSTEEQPFLCSLCGMIFPSKEDLECHHSLLHEEDEHQAEEQEAVLEREAGERLDRAGDQEEEQLLSHICGYCGQTFDDMASLEEHSEGHQEEKAAALADTSIQLRRAPRLEEEQEPPPPAEAPATAVEPLDSRPYACGQCGKTYRHGGSLVNHKKIHQIGDYQCGFCCRQYPNLSAYRNHLRNHPRCKLNGSVPELRQPDPAGAGGPPVGCEAPKEESLDGRAAVQQKGEDLPNTSSSPLPSPVVEEKSGQEALAAGQSEERDVCGEACEGLAGLEAHRALHFDQETGKVEGEENGGPSAEEEGSPLERPFQCDVCERSYKHAGSLINHKQTHKTGLFHCGVCQKQFFNLMALKNHNRTHFETKRYRCPECPKAFRLQNSAAKHRPDPEERPYRCEECGRTYRHAGSLLNHQKSHKTGHFACSLCSKAYPNLMSLKNHQRIHYEVKRHRCPDCGKAFKWQRQLLRHQRRPHPCGQSTCPKHFPNRAALRNHSRVHAKKRFQCSECGKPYRASRSLKRHLRRHQSEAVRPYKCNSCERTYRHAGSLLNHKKAHATGLYRCPTCQKEFHNLLALKNHLHVHTDKRRHRCPCCGKAFRTARRLAAHAKAHGSLKEEGPFSCSVCSKGFSHQLSFRQHLLSTPTTPLLCHLEMLPSSNLYLRKLGSHFEN